MNFLLTIVSFKLNIIFNPKLFWKFEINLIGWKYDSYIIIEVIELDDGNISAAAWKKKNNEKLSLTVPHLDFN